jgi:hypothetical protein
MRILCLLRTSNKIVEHSQKKTAMKIRIVLGSVQVDFLLRGRQTTLLAPSNGNDTRVTRERRSRLAGNAGIHFAPRIPQRQGHAAPESAKKELATFYKANIKPRCRLGTLFVGSHTLVFQKTDPAQALGQMEISSPALALGSRIPIYLLASIRCTCGLAQRSRTKEAKT